MLEGVLEKILISFFGKYITGLDKKNLQLGVWSGNVTIENVNLKPEILDLLELPLDLKHSYIGSLKLVVPWSKLSSAPIKVILEKVFVVCTLKQRDEWAFRSMNDFLNKFERLQTLAKEISNKYNCKFNKETDPKNDNDPSYIDKMTKKILDNLELKIKDIHIRFERNVYSVGITLSEILMFTTDESNKKCFLDRTDAENKKRPLHKGLELQNFRIYWNSKEDVLIGEKYINTEASNHYLLELIHSKKNINDLLTIFANAKLIQYPNELLEYPKYQVFFDLKNMDLNFENRQLEQLIELVIYFSDYTNEMMIKRKNETSLISENFLENEVPFLCFYQKIFSDENKSLASLNLEERQMFEKIIIETPEESLNKWIKKTVKRLTISSKMNEVQKKKKTWKWGKALDAASLSLEERQNIETAMEKICEEDDNEILSKRPSGVPWMKFDFIIENVDIGLVKIYETGEEESINLKISDYNLNLHLFDVGYIFKMTIFEAVASLQKLSNHGEQILAFDFLKKGKESQSVLLADLFFERGTERAPDEVTTNLFIYGFNFVYSPIVIRQILDWVDVKDKNKLMDFTYDNINKLEENTQETIKKVLEKESIKLNLRIKILTPSIFIPVNSKEYSNDLWQFRSSVIEIKNDGLEKCNCQFSQLSLSLIDNIFSKGQEKIVINESDINLSLNSTWQKNLKGKLYELSFFSKDLTANFDNESYNKILYLPVSLSVNELKSESRLKKEKEQIIKGSIFYELLGIRGKYFKFWAQHHCYFCNDKLFCFASEESLIPSLQISLQGIKVEEFHSDRPFCLRIASRTENEYILSLKNDAVKELWKQKFKNIEKDFKSTVENDSKISLNMKITKFTFGFFSEFESFAIFTGSEFTFVLDYENEVLNSRMFIFRFDGEQKGLTDKLIESENFGMMMAYDLSGGESKPFDFKISLDFSSIVYVWTSETLYHFRKILQPYKYKSLSQDSIVYEKPSYRKALIVGEVNFENIVVYFLEKNTEIFFMKLDSGKSQIEFEISNLDFHFGMKFTKIALKDLTNFPTTSHAKCSYKKCMESTFFNLQQIEDEDEVPLQINFCSFYFPEENISADVNVLCSNGELLFYLQYIIRVNDYFFNQILSPLTNSLNLNKTQIELENTVLQPLFLRTNILIKKFHVLFGSKIDSQNLLSFSFESLDIRNSSITNLYEIFENQFGLLNNCSISFGSNTVSNQFSIDFTITRPLYREEVKELIKKYNKSIILLDNKLYIELALQNFEMELSKEDYWSLLMLLYYNFTFDDFKDKYFIDNYEVSLLRDFLEIDLKMKIEKFKLSLGLKTTIASIYICNTEISWKKLKDSNMELDLSKEISNILLTNIANSETKGFMGCCLLESINENGDIWQMQNQRISTQIKLTLTRNQKGESVVSINLKGGIFLANIKTYLLLLDFVQIPEICWPPSKDALPKLSITFHAEEFTIGIPDHLRQALIALTTNFIVIYKRNRILPYENYIREEKENINSFISSEEIETNSLLIQASKTFFFICRIHEILTKPFEEITKRSLLSSGTLTAACKCIFFPEKSSQDFYFYLWKIEISVQPTLIKLSQRDVSSLWNLYEIQMKELGDDKKEAQLKDSKMAFYVENSLEFYFESFEIVMNFIQVLIDDFHDVLIPILKFTIYDSQVLFMISSKKMISFFLKLSCDFYNCKVSCWEPIIENIGFDIDLIIGEKLFLAIQKNQYFESLNLNISKEFVKLFI